MKEIEREYLIELVSILEEILKKMEKKRIIYKIFWSKNDAERLNKYEELYFYCITKLGKEI